MRGKVWERNGKRQDKSWRWSEMDQRDVGGEKGVKEAKVVSTDRIRRILDIGGEVIERDKFILSWHRMVGQVSISSRMGVETMYGTMYTSERGVDCDIKSRIHVSYN
jgi:hypothetical protein